MLLIIEAWSQIDAESFGEKSLRGLSTAPPSLPFPFRQVFFLLAFYLRNLQYLLAGCSI